MNVIHSNATRQSYAFARALVLVVGLITLADVYVSIYPEFPLGNIGKRSINALIPMVVWQRLMTNALWLHAYQVSGLLAFFAALFPYKRPFFVTWAALVATSVEALGSSGTSGGDGSISHDTATSIYLLYVVVVYDWIEWRRTRTKIESDALARSALFCMMVMFMLTYSLIGVRRLAYGGIELFLSDTPGYWFIARGHGGIRGHVELAWTQHLVEWPWVLRAMTAGFVVTTIMEVLAPLVLVSKRFAIIFAAWMLCFHAMTYISMDIVFWQSVVFFVLLLDYHPWVTSRSATGTHNPIVFFDGVCAFCNRSVDILMKWDPAGILRFAPLQGETARAHIGSRQGDPEGWSMYYEDEHGVYEGHDAVLRCVQRLGWPYMLLALGRLVPSPVRNVVYRIIARNRYRWFGKRETCRIPAPDERARFLE